MTDQCTVTDGYSALILKFTSRIQKHVFTEAGIFSKKYHLYRVVKHNIDNLWPLP